jgi:hypothetical protein
MRHHLGLGDSIKTTPSLEGVKELKNPLDLRIIDVKDIWEQKLGINFTEAVLAKLLQVGEFSYSQFLSRYKGKKTKAGRAPKTNITAIAAHYGHTNNGGKLGAAYIAFMNSSYHGFDWSALKKGPGQAPKGRKGGKRLSAPKTHSGLAAFYGECASRFVSTHSLNIILVML